MKKNIDKNELYELMNELTDIEHGMRSFLHVLRVADTYYQTQVYSEEMMAIIGVSTRLIESMQKELSKQITKLDEMIIG